VRLRAKEAIPGREPDREITEDLPGTRPGTEIKYPENTPKIGINSD